MSTSEQTRTLIRDVTSVSIPVGDVDRALEFYTSTLGFETRVDLAVGNGRRWVEVAPPGAATTIALSPPGPGQTPGGDTGIRFTTADVEADHAALKAHGVDVDPEIMRWPNAPPMFQLRDPDGNLLRVFQQETGERVADDRSAKRFAVLVKSDARTEAGAMPTEAELAAMGRFNDELVDAGMMLAGEGFHASSDGARLVWGSGSVDVVPGPFAEPTQLVAGFWVIRAGSLDEAVEWMRRAPFDEGAELEIRQIFEADDFGDEFTPELREQEDRQREKIAAAAGRH